MISILESKVMAMTGHTKHSTIKRYTHIVDELLQEAPYAALARYLPDQETFPAPKLLTEIVSFLNGT